MFHHVHPYPPFLFPETKKLIVGTLPPPRFTTKRLKAGDVDFSYGSKDNLLWPILDRIFELGLYFETSKRAILQRTEFLKKRHIGICDIVQSADRSDDNASDLGMRSVVLRDVLGHLREYPKIETILFMGGNSKNGPEYFFRKQLMVNGATLEVVSEKVPRIHRFKVDGRSINTVSLTAPSGAANRAIGSMPEYKALKLKQPSFNTFDYRVRQYASFFMPFQS